MMRTSPSGYSHLLQRVLKHLSFDAHARQAAGVLHLNGSVEGSR